MNSVSGSTGTVWRHVANHKQLPCVCGGVFLRRQGQKKTHCGCLKRNVRSGPLDRFVSKVSFGDGCWEWTASKNIDGYGLFDLERRQEKAHRAAWIFHNGGIPAWASVCHRCDNPGCVRPEHLFLGTHQENMDDAKHKGRCHLGERHGASKLTWEKIDKIRLMRGQPQKVISLAFGVSQSAVSKILSGELWPPKHRPAQHTAEPRRY